jgi:hypothetical protein
MTRKNKTQARGKKNNKEKKKKKIQNSKLEIKNLNTKRCTRNASLVMMDTKMQKAKKRHRVLNMRCVLGQKSTKKKGDTTKRKRWMSKVQKEGARFK